MAFRGVSYATRRWSLRGTVQARGTGCRDLLVETVRRFVSVDPGFCFLAQMCVDKKIKFFFCVWPDAVRCSGCVGRDVGVGTSDGVVA